MEQEIMLVDISAITEQDSAAELALNNQIEQIDAELARNASQATAGDYALAVASGILAGVIDILFVGDAPIVGSGADEARGGINEQVNRFIQSYASDHGYKGERLDGAIKYLEDNYAVAQDNIWKGAGIDVSAKEHHLADLAHHPTPLGLASAIVVQFLRVGTFVNDKGELHLLFVDTKPEDIANSVVPIVMTGFLNWLVAIAENEYEEETGEKAPEAVIKLAHLVASSPIIIELVKCANNWIGHLVSDMGGSKNTAGKGMGIPGFFFSLLYEFAGLPLVNKLGLTNFLNDLYVKQHFDMRHELVVVEALGKQAVPVMVNEAIVRMGYLVSRLVSYYNERDGLDGIDWSDVVPIGNRTVERMITVSSTTLSLIDSADAAAHAAIESAGNFVLFTERFVSRFNFVAAGRATLAIVREVSAEAKETQLLREKQLLIEAKTSLTIERLETYRALLEERVSEYLAEDLQAFFEGMSQIDQGLIGGDSNLVIRGNVTIQRVLGREPQFTNQQEFDDLMMSDDDFVL